MKTNKKAAPYEEAAKSQKHAESSANSAAAQRERILVALRRSPLTTLEARRLLDVLHPAARVQELRDRGYQIMTAWKQDYTAEGRQHRVAQYVLQSEVRA